LFGSETQKLINTNNRIHNNYPYNPIIFYLFMTMPL